jgi:heme/copper-type cytochrome/quinol oxidase subunit 3
MRATPLTYPSVSVARIRRGRRQPALADGVFGMLIFVATEAMFFTALISAFVIIKAGVDLWSPPPGVRLPVIATACNTAILLLSAAFLHRAGRAFSNGKDRALVRTLLGGAALLGSAFVLFQGYEWVRLTHYGMTVTSGIFGACFFLLIGTHGLHAAAAALALISLYVQLRRGTLKLDHLRAMQIFWYFVVGIWPVLYGLVYF